MFTTVSSLHEGIRQLSLLNGGGDLEVVRVKDSFGEPKPSGWRCIYFSLGHVSSGLIGELQVTFDKIKAINGRSHRIYDLVRSLERSVEPAARTANGDEETTPRRRDALTDLTKANNFFHRHALARCEVTGYCCDVCGLNKDGPTAMQRCKACLLYTSPSPRDS